MSITVRPSTGRLEWERLIEVWRRSVVATHDFLTPADVADIESRLSAVYFPAVTLTMAEDETGRIVGFSGTSGNQLEMLFIDPTARGQGVGTSLLHEALSRIPDLELDVNEQNPQARGFYESRGFRVVGRSEVDSDGRPFPLLHMRYEPDATDSADTGD